MLLLVPLLLLLLRPHLWAQLLDDIVVRRAEDRIAHVLFGQVLRLLRTTRHEASFFEGRAQKPSVGRMLT